MPNVVTTVVDDEDPQMYEDEHVHAVYDNIASHFSSTRYKVCILNSRAPLYLTIGFRHLSLGPSLPSL